MDEKKLRELIMQVQAEFYRYPCSGGAGMRRMTADATTVQAMLETLLQNAKVLRERIADYAQIAGKNEQELNQLRSDVDAVRRVFAPVVDKCEPNV